MKALLLLFSAFLLLAGGKPKPAALRPGKDYALFFAVKDYKNSVIEDLNNPVWDAVALAALLHDRYGFDTAVVRNPTRKQLIGTLENYRKQFAAHASGKFDPGGQLLIFFLGHGESYLGNGYFLPADADPGDLTATAIDYHWCRNFINTIECQHILVGVNACYSGMFDPEWKGKLSGGPAGDQLPNKLNKGEKLIEDLEAWRTRRLLASCSGVTKTPDDDNQFIRRWLEALQMGGGDDRMLDFFELYAFVQGGISPSPKEGFWGDNQGSGTFIFFEKPKPISSLPEPGKTDDEAFQKDIAAYGDAKKCGTIDCYKWYLDNFPYGDFRIEADAAIKIEEEKKRRRREDLDWEAAQLKDTPAAYQKYLDAYDDDGRYRKQAAQLKREREEAEKASTSEVGGVSPYPAGFEYLAHDMVFVQGGEFEMGDLFGDGYVYEVPVHKVTLSSFRISRYEVTNQQFCAFLNEKGNQTEGGAEWIELRGRYLSEKCRIQKSGSKFIVEAGYEKHPVIYVSWFGATAYAKWLAEKTHKNFRLPTEAEWEFAARSRGQKEKWAGTSSESNLIQFANLYGDKDGFAGTAPVGSLDSNDINLNDMSGNVYEWCSDLYGSYSSDSQKDPNGATTGTYRVCRGGSCFFDIWVCRASARGNYEPSFQHCYLGFRLAQD